MIEGKKKDDKNPEEELKLTKQEVQYLFLNGDFKQIVNKHKKKELLEMYETLVGLGQVDSKSKKIDIATKIWEYARLLRTSQEILGKTWF